MKKIITAVLAVTMAVGMLTGCGSGTGKKEASGEKLVIWTNMNVEVDTIQKYAIEHGRPGDVIILAGKGHETYQEIKGVKYDMDERVLIKEVLEELKK